MKSPVSERSKVRKPASQAVSMAFAQGSSIPPIAHQAQPAQETLHATIAPRRSFVRLSSLIQWLDDALPLPETKKEFGIYLFALLIVVSGLMTHVLLSAQILQSQVELTELREKRSIIERETGEILWEIGRVTNLQTVEERAKADGYAPITEREFVDVLVQNTPVAPTGSGEAPSGSAAAFSGQLASSARDAALESSALSIEVGDDAASTGAANLESLSKRVSNTQIGRLRQWQALLFPGAAMVGVPALDNMQSLREGTSNGRMLWRAGWQSDLVENVRTWLDDAASE